MEAIDLPSSIDDLKLRLTDEALTLSMRDAVVLSRGDGEVRAKAISNQPKKCLTDPPTTEFMRGISNRK